jgi:hypothetical protein
MGEPYQGIEVTDAEISEEKLKEIIKATKHMVVSNLDKGGQAIWVECPTRHMEAGFKKFVLEEKNFVESKSCEEAKIQIKKIYYACGLNELMDYREGKIPSMRLAPKLKAPLLKYRLITSYFGFPMRALLKCAGKSLRFMLREVHEKSLMKSFTLFKMSDVKMRLLKLRSYKNKKDFKAYQTDVKCMFTNLSKESVLSKVTRLIELFKVAHRGKPKGITVDKFSPGLCYRGINKGLDGTIDLKFDHLKKIVLWDLESTYSRYGDKVFFQKEGIPIGGMCSSIYADIQCAFDENDLITNNQGIENNLLAIRQIDDLLVLSDRGDIMDVVKGAYHEGLELEDEEVKEVLQKNGTTKQSFCFVGLDITLQGGMVKAKITNQNTKGIRTTGTQKKPRFALKSPYRAKALYKQVISGALYRIRDYCIGKKAILQSVKEFCEEFTCIGYERDLFRSTLKEFIRAKVEHKKRKVWLQAFELL